MDAIDGFGAFLAERYGRNWCVAPRLTDRMRRSGYEAAIPQKRYTALQAEYERLTGEEARRIAADYKRRYGASLADMLNRTTAATTCAA